MSYDKTIWHSKDIITREKMQKIEDQLELLSNSSSDTPEISVDWDDITNKPTISNDWDDITNKPAINKSGTNNKGIIEGGAASAVDYSHAEGLRTTASGDQSHAEGVDTKALGNYSHAEGGGTTARGGYSHAEGGGTTASGSQSHAEGGGTTASGVNSHAEGGGTQAVGSCSHAEGQNTIADKRSQHVFGEYNIIDNQGGANNSIRGAYVEIVGNGTSTNDRQNARTLDWSGNESLAGSLTLGKGTTDEVTVTAAQLKALLALLNVN